MSKFAVWVSVLLAFGIFDANRGAEFGGVVIMAIVLTSTIEFYFLYEMQKLVKSSRILTKSYASRDISFPMFLKFDKELAEKWEEFNSNFIANFVFEFGAIFRALVTVYFINRLFI